MKTAENDAQNKRAKELRSIFMGVDKDIRALVGPTVENVLYLEERMAEFAALPMIQVHPADPMRQRSTPAARLYKEFLQQHTNCIKTLAIVLNRNGHEEESPLRQWLNERKAKNGTG